MPSGESRIDACSHISLRSKIWHRISFQPPAETQPKHHPMSLCIKGIIWPKSYPIHVSNLSTYFVDFSMCGTWNGIWDTKFGTVLHKNNWMYTLITMIGQKEVILSFLTLFPSPFFISLLFHCGIYNGSNIVHTLSLSHINS